MTDLAWLLEFAQQARGSDRLADRDSHVELLAAGLIGEAGSLISEMKKKRREQEAYPAYRHKAVEETGDFLWYFVRLCDVTTPGLLDELANHEEGELPRGDSIAAFLAFGAAVGDTLAAIQTSNRGRIRRSLLRVWSVLVLISEGRVSLRAAAEQNTGKTHSRWPDSKTYSALFDDDFPEWEQLPRQLHIDFIGQGQKSILLRCNGINFGDRLTDNITDPDGYRFHDIFHFAYAVHLGWSPVLRALMRTKRKSNSTVDEAEDGARAAIIEEAVSAIVFARAKHLNFFQDLHSVDLDLLKTVREFVEGYEVHLVPLWQWETAILKGFEVFRQLRSHGGGSVRMDLRARTLTYTAPGTSTGQPPSITKGGT